MPNKLSASWLWANRLVPFGRWVRGRRAGTRYNRRRRRRRDAPFRRFFGRLGGDEKRVAALATARPLADRAVAGLHLVAALWTGKAEHGITRSSSERGDRRPFCL